VVLTGARGNAELKSKFHAALLASQAAIPTLTSEFLTKVAPPAYQHQNFTQCHFPTAKNKIRNCVRVQLRASSNSLLATLFILPSPLPNVLSTLNLLLPKGGVDTAWDHCIRKFKFKFMPFSVKCSVYRYPTPTPHSLFSIFSSASIKNSEQMQ
jgi:hypothetical protein